MHFKPDAYQAASGFFVHEISLGMCVYLMQAITYALLLSHKRTYVRSYKKV